jgi:hypothetical protein
MPMRSCGLAAFVAVMAIAACSRPSERDEPLERGGRTGNCGLSRATVTVLKRLAGKTEIRGYFSERTHPMLAPLVPQLGRWLRAYERAAEGTVRLSIVDPAASPDAAREAERLGVRALPFRVDEPGQQTVVQAFFHIVLSHGGRDRIVGLEDLVRVEQAAGGSLAARLDNPEYEITAALKKLAAGARAPRIALWTPPAASGQTFEVLRQSLGQAGEVMSADLTGALDPSLDALVLAGPVGLTPVEVRAVENLVSRGGGLVVLAGRYRLDPSARELRLEKVNTGLEELFTRWGVSLEDALVLDEESDSFPMPVDRDVGGMTVREFRQIRYPYFVRLAPDRIQAGPIGRGVSNAAFHFASPVRIAGKPGAVLVRSSDRAWLDREARIAPDFAAHPESGFPAPPAGTARAVQPLAVAVGRRTVIVGSSSFASDALIELGRQAGTDNQNLVLAGNLVAWALEDSELVPLHGCRGAEPPR